MAYSAHHLFLFAFTFLLTIAASRVDAWGGRLFFTKTTRPEAVELDKAATTTTTSVVPEAADPNSAPAFSRPSSSGGSRGYGLYGRPEENYPPAYFRRGVHRNAEKLTTTNVDVPTTAPEEETAVPVVESSGEDAEPSFPDNGSGRGRPLSYARMRRGRQQRRQYGMSDTRLYQNGRYYYDVGTGKYGYGYESNPVRTRPEEFGSGYGRAGGERRVRYGDAAAVYEYGNGDEFGNGVVEKQSGFQENQNEQYIP